MPMMMEQTQCSETSATKHHTPGNNPKYYTQYIDVVPLPLIRKQVATLLLPFYISSLLTYVVTHLSVCLSVSLSLTQN
jgi:hypothetical protein